MRSAQILAILATASVGLAAPTKYHHHKAAPVDNDASASADSSTDVSQGGTSILSPQIGNGIMNDATAASVAGDTTTNSDIESTVISLAGLTLRRRGYKAPSSSDNEATSNADSSTEVSQDGDSIFSPQIGNGIENEATAASVAGDSETDTTTDTTSFTLAGLTARDNTAESDADSSTDVSQDGFSFGSPQIANGMGNTATAASVAGDTEENTDTDSFSFTLAGIASGMDKRDNTAESDADSSTEVSQDGTSIFSPQIANGMGNTATGASVAGDSEVNEETNTKTFTLGPLIAKRDNTAESDADSSTEVSQDGTSIGSPQIANGMGNSATAASVAGDTEEDITTTTKSFMASLIGGA